jgi:phosphoserine phosphatase
VSRFLVVFDVDSTLIQDEVIELLAEEAGKRTEVAAITDAAMRGELDFSESLKARVATLAGLPESVIQATFDRVRLTAGAEQLIDHIHSIGGLVGAVSGGFDQILSPLAERLKLDFHLANQLGVSDAALTGMVDGPIIDKSAKAAALKQWAEQSGLSTENTTAVGDGANDLQMMSTAGLGVAFNAKPIVRENANLVVELADLSELIPLFR